MDSAFSFHQDLLQNVDTSIIADVINMFRLEGVWESKKSPLAPLFEKGGTLTLRHCSLPYGTIIKGGQGDLIKRPIGTYF